MLQPFGNPCSSYFNLDSFSFTWNIHLKFVLVWSGLRNIENFIKSTGESRLAFVKDIKACFIIFLPWLFRLTQFSVTFFYNSLIPLIFHLFSSFCPCKADKKHVKLGFWIGHWIWLRHWLWNFCFLPTVTDWRWGLRAKEHLRHDPKRTTFYMHFAACCPLNVN